MFGNHKRDSRPPARRRVDHSASCRARAQAYRFHEGPAIRLGLKYALGGYRGSRQGHARFNQSRAYCSAGPDISYPELGYGAIRALRDANVRVPEDLSVIGFGDIQLAAFHTPRLTTIRQPLREMGESAARLLLQRLQGFRDYPSELAVPPELIIRETTAPANSKAR